MPESAMRPWLTYREASAVLGISPEAVRIKARRENWPRQTPNTTAGRARVQIPDEMLSDRSQTGMISGRPAVDLRLSGDRVSGVPRAVNSDDRSGSELVRAFDRALAALQAQLSRERERVDRAERRIDQLTAELADALVAERISAASAAALRAEIDALRRRAPWWRRWFS